MAEGQIAIVGDNASGKTMFIESPSLFEGKVVRYLRFRDSYGALDGQYYHQLRWNQQEIDEETPTVGAMLASTLDSASRRAFWSLPAEESFRQNECRARLRDRLVNLFGLEKTLDKYIITLSSGELRKFQLIKALLDMPQILVIDNPFIGLDSRTRNGLSELLCSIVEESDIQLILVMSREDMIPPFITRVIRMKGGKQDFSGHIPNLPSKDMSLVPFYPKSPNSEIIRCKGVTVRYGSRVILKDFDWIVREGERWAITGENGAGKSTLLSLICADNPQGYACDIELFGHRRGSGESIWEIKKHIGYVSPEMHRSYQKNIPALDIVASGLFDTVGLFIHPSEQQLSVCLEWMKTFGIEDLADRPFLKISSGEQRLCLLARAFVKDPELLILDEPMHGIDERRCDMVKKVIDEFVRRDHKTLLMVTHYESELPDCIDHRLSMKSN